MKTQQVNMKIDNERLLQVWEIVRWFDDARWNIEETNEVLIPGPSFQDLGKRARILVHWLTYITDQQRPAEDVWSRGGPVFSEIVRQYTEERTPTYDVLKRFTSISPKKGGVDLFTSQQQVLDGNAIAYAPRWGVHIISLVRTLHFLEKYNRDIVQYLSSNWDFVGRAKQRMNGDNAVSRIAFILYLLTYSDVKKGMVSLQRNEKGIKRHIENYSRRLDRLLGDEETLTSHFYRWTKEKRYHKRLWAALRDYLKPKSPFHTQFVGAAEELGDERLSVFLREPGAQILESLELPGDIWNLRFIKKVFEGKIDSPEALREVYENLKLSHEISERYYPEQFDISFSFSPYMCEEEMEEFCPFRRISRVREYCFHPSLERKLCPVAMITCGYSYYCNPENCPIKDGVKEDLCPGCSVKIGTRRN